MIWISWMTVLVFGTDFEWECVQSFGMELLCGLSRATYPQTVTNRLSPREKWIYYEKKWERFKGKHSLKSLLLKAATSSHPGLFHNSVSALSVCLYDWTQICHFNQPPSVQAFLLKKHIFFYFYMHHNCIDYALWTTQWGGDLMLKWIEIWSLYFPQPPSTFLGYIPPRWAFV